MHFRHLFYIGSILFIKQMTFDSKLSLSQIFVASNPRGAESLPPGIVVSESDFYLRRLWGEPSEVC